MVVGEDALIASGEWLRNHDMHDLCTGGRLGRPPVDTVLQGDIRAV
jgi:hypothetical protein